ncbi:hypothetical protein HDU98_010723 [Podochytrium sp. JEL0797]|nr:hypothetical protein HDU98_010723 [Podochytrium sp. JEL0797]
MSDQKESLLPPAAAETARASEYSLARFALCFTTALAIGVLVVALHRGHTDHISPTLNTYLACSLFIRTGSYLQSVNLTQVVDVLAGVIKGVINGHGLADLWREMPSAVFNIPLIAITVFVRRIYKKEVAQFVEEHAQVIGAWELAGFGYVLGSTFFPGMLAYIPDGWQNISLVYTFPFYVMVTFVFVVVGMLTCAAVVMGIVWVWTWWEQKQELGKEEDELSEIKVEKDA